MANRTKDLPLYHRFLRGKGTITSSTTVSSNKVTITRSAVSAKRHTLIGIICKSDLAGSVVTVTDGATDKFSLPVGSGIQVFDLAEMPYTGSENTSLSVALTVTSAGHLAIFTYSDDA